MGRDFYNEGRYAYGESHNSTDSTDALFDMIEALRRDVLELERQLPMKIGH